MGNVARPVLSAEAHALHSIVTVVNKQSCRKRTWLTRFHLACPQNAVYGLLSVCFDVFVLERTPIHSGQTSDSAEHTWRDPGIKSESCLQVIPSAAGRKPIELLQTKGQIWTQRTGTSGH